MVVTEALARGIPVLATRVGGLPEALGRAPGGRRPASWCRRRRVGARRARWSSGSGDPALRAHLRAAARDRRPTLPTWAAASAEVAGCSSRWRRDPAPWSPVNRGPGPPVGPGEQVSPDPDVGRGRRAGREADIEAAWWRWARPLGGALVLAALVVGLGTGPFLEAVRATDLRALSAGAAIAVVTTVCAAWRWRLVARRLGVELTLGGAVAACYRAQFLNVTLPGGVLGDVGRGVQARS